MTAVPEEVTTMTDYQFKAIIKMVLAILRKAQLDMCIDIRKCAGDHRSPLRCHTNCFDR